MKLIIIAVGQHMPAWVKEAWQDFAKRLPPDCALDLKEIKAEPRTGGKTPAQMMAAEAKRILAATPAHTQIVALDEHGRDLSTMALAQELRAWRAGGRDVVFLVGGPDGLDAGLKKNCHSLIRLSSMTLPHAMVRVILAEQLYRAWAIMVNHPYHRA